MPSYLSWSNRFVITYYTDEHGVERKKTRRATKEDQILPYRTPKPESPIQSYWIITKDKNYL